MPRGAAEAGGKKSLNELQRERRSDHLSAETKDIHVVVFDALTGRKHVMDQSGAHPRDLIRGDRGANAAAAQRHPALDLARRDSPRQGDDEIRVVISRVQPICAEVLNVIAVAAQSRAELDL
jgi:hypothetical protein